MVSHVLSGLHHLGKPTVGLLIALALGIALPASGCGGGSGSNVAATSAANTTTQAIRHSGPTVAVLHPVGDVKASGTARYRKGPDGSPLLELRARGLEPVSGDRQYVVWQKHSRNDMVLLATWVVGKDGRLVETWSPSFASLQYLELGLRTKLLITKVELNDRLYEPSTSDNSYKHSFIGHPVLEGDFTGALVGSKEQSG